MNIPDIWKGEISSNLKVLFKEPLKNTSQLLEEDKRRVENIYMQNPLKTDATIKKSLNNALESSGRFYSLPQVRQHLDSI